MILPAMILPGSTIGILGGGQLGKMLCMKAAQMGYKTHVFVPQADSPASHVATLTTVADYEDKAALQSFAEAVNVVTLEFENIPVFALEALAERVPVHPAPQVLYIAQHRGREKAFLSEHGFPLAPFKLIDTEADLAAAVEEIGTPAILKTAGFGYDGKGQHRVSSLAEAEAAFAELEQQPCVLEAFVDFEREVSVVAARSEAGELIAYAPIENDHENHILSLSGIPAELSDALAKRAVQVTKDVLNALNLVGVMCAEFFVTSAGELILNELAPRPHNSGHLTIEACAVSQFEQQLRAVCALPLGSTDYLHAAAMVNLLGDVWADGEPDWTRVLEQDNFALHLYGKAEARLGRKMGHLTLIGEDGARVKEKALHVKELLS